MDFWRFCDPKWVHWPLTINDDSILDIQSGGNEGRRDVKALANPNQADSWDGKAYTEGGLIAMALGYQKAHYKGPPEDSGNENEAFDADEKTQSSTAD